MIGIHDVIKKNVVALQIALLLIASAYLSLRIAAPLVDYDEATYAKVVVDTMKTGDISTFTLSGKNWFEKPPLYLWEAMASVKVFGVHEFSFRIPSIIASIMCLWLVFLIIAELTGDLIAASSAFLILLAAAPFYAFAIQARLDSSVIMAMLAALYFYIRSWRNEKFLSLVLPIVAVGFLYKSFVIALIVPIILIYSLCYRKWGWIRSRHFWTGLVPALAIFLPWHIIETARFGWGFWDQYVGYQVIHRSVSTLTGTADPLLYMNILWTYCSYWTWTVLAIIAILIALSAWRATRPFIHWRRISAPLASASLIILLFSLLHTHLPTYMMPAIPFIALFIGIALSEAAAIPGRHLSLRLVKSILAVVVILLLGLGASESWSAYFDPETPVVHDEQMMGKLYASRNDDSAPLYSLIWMYLETLNYYGNTSTHYIQPESGGLIKGPFYIVVTSEGLKLFTYDDNGVVRSRYPDLEFLYSGKALYLLYSPQDIQLPTFNYAPISNGNQ